MPATIENTGLFDIPFSHLQDPQKGRPSGSATKNPLRILRAGEHLFRTGDRVEQPYRVVGGILKCYFIHEDGDEQVIGFHLPGDLIGWDALADERAAFSAVALNTSSVGRLAAASSSSSLEEHKEKERALVACMQKDVLRLARLLHMERSGTDARLARFLLDYAEAQGRRGFSQSEFRLPMGRRDLARYIGLAPETVSRIFSRLRTARILHVGNNHIVIRDRNALEYVARERKRNGRAECA